MKGSHPVIPAALPVIPAALPVIPAKAGTQLSRYGLSGVSFELLGPGFRDDGMGSIGRARIGTNGWVPAFAGTTLA